MVTVPSGGEPWQRGLEYFIRWEDNLAEDVTIELYKGDVFLKEVATVSSIGAYAWEADLAADPGDDYTIRIRSSVDELVTDTSDAAFILE